MGLLVILILYGIESTQGRYYLPQPHQPPLLFITHCEDNLRKATLKALDRAQHSVRVHMYTCNDSKILKKLNQIAKNQISVSIKHDASCSQQGFKQLYAPIQKYPSDPKRLMHKKILCVDEQDVWIGSANWTHASLDAHENILVALHCPELAHTLSVGKTHSHFTVGGQRIEFWDFPKQGKEGLERLLTLIAESQHSIRLAMFALTHPLLVQALIQAHQRGVRVEIILDTAMTKSVNLQAYKRLTQASVPVHLHTGLGTLHYKLAWIDNLLIEGSANWTQAAFTRNEDCLLMLHDLTPLQKRKLKSFWKALQAKSAQHK